MGTPDKVLKDLFRDPAVFADAFNFLFEEKGFRVDPAALRELDPDQVVLSLGVDAEIEVERIRDLMRAMVSMTDGRTAYLILGIENQENIHLAMPVLVMLKDSMQYSSQVQAAARSYRKKRQEEINVCKAIEDMIRDAVQQKDTELQRKQTEIQNLQEQNAALKKKMDLFNAVSFSGAASDT